MAKKTTRKTAKTAKKAVKKAAKKTVQAAPKPPVKKPAPKAFQEGGIFADVEHLMDIMVTHDVTEVAIEDGKRKINLRRGAFVPPVVGTAAPIAAPVAAPASAPVAAAEEAKPADNYIEITSPMVGTFYAAPSPDADAFAQLGDKINGSTVVCIVEAMKVMNEIKAECSGEIVEVCVKNAEPVEFGQVLFRVKP